MSSNFGEHFWFSNIGISIQPYQHSEVLYLSLERLELTLLLSLLVSMRDLSGTFAHETVGRLSISTYAVTLSFYGYVAMLKYSTRRRTTSTILAADLPSQQRGPRNTSSVLHSSDDNQLLPCDCQTKNNARDNFIFVTLSQFL